MSEIRGEKISFSRKEITPLHDLPSAQTADPIIVHCPLPRSQMRRAGRTMALFLMLVIVAAGSVFFAIEGGAVDSMLSARASEALNNAIGPRYTARVGATAIRFDSDMRLALEARDVDIIEQATGQHLSRTEVRSEEHTSELQSLMRTSYAVFCLKKKKHTKHKHTNQTTHTEGKTNM